MLMSSGTKGSILCGMHLREDAAAGNALAVVLAGAAGTGGNGDARERSVNLNRRSSDVHDEHILYSTVAAPSRVLCFVAGL